MDRTMSLLKTIAPALVLIIALAAVGCAAGTPEEQVALTRASYTVELNSFRVLEPEPPAEEAAEGTEGEEAADNAADESAADESASDDGAADAGDGEGGDGDGEGAEGEDEAAAGPVNVRFDIFILYRPERSRDTLDQLTIDITHADSAQQEKAVIHHTVDVSGMIKGDSRQADFVLEGIEFEEGDIFAASVASGVPADLSKFPEFAAAGGQ